jgi:hypothetical protein
MPNHRRHVQTEFASKPSEPAMLVIVEPERDDVTARPSPFLGDWHSASCDKIGD